MSRAAVLDPARPGDELAPPEPQPRGAAQREERPPSGDSPSPSGAGGGRLALGDLVAGAWEGLLAAGSAACPVCEGPMQLDGGVGRCRGCGSRLA